MSTFDRLRSILSTSLRIPPEAIEETTQDKDLPGWDSLAHLSIMMSVEQEFDVVLDVEDFASLNSVPAILAYLANKSVA